MHWKQLDPANPPMEEVLAKYEDTMLIGYISVSHGSDDGCRVSNGSYCIYDPTHYILVSDLAKLHNELRP